MSWSALDWASKQKTGNGTNKLVLLCLANYADDKNTCFPSYKTLISITEMSRSTIIRSLKSLENIGLIKIEERFADFNEGKRQTSNLYTLNVGYQTDTHPVQNDTHPSITMKPHITSNNKPIKYSSDFNEWWNLYPRNDGSKKKAYDLFINITDKIINFDELYSKTVQYKNSMHEKDPKFIPHATTWLNQRRWETVEEKTRINLNQLVG
tara:strand:+ start:6680 stop:7306 length:627 start_codon:yes stop_codon:yes gene_type:complete